MPCHEKQRALALRKARSESVVAAKIVRNDAVRGGRKSAKYGDTIACSIVAEVPLDGVTSVAVVDVERSTVDPRAIGQKCFILFDGTVGATPGPDGVRSADGELVLHAGVPCERVSDYGVL